MTAKFYARGKAEGRALVTDKSLCFWGGLDPETGKIIETGHPLEEQNITGKVLIFPRGHGSSSSSGVLLEAIRCNHGPATIINIFCESIIATGTIVAVSEDDFKNFFSDVLLRVDDKENSITILE